MDAVEYLKKRDEICDAHSDCQKCPLGDGVRPRACFEREYNDPELMVEEVKHGISNIGSN